MKQCIKIYYSMFIWSSACFGRHIVHHQELKTALAASGFAYVKGCWTLRLLDSSWWWAVCCPKHVELHITWNNKFWYIVASCWLFLYELCLYAFKVIRCRERMQCRCLWISYLELKLNAYKQMTNALVFVVMHMICYEMESCHLLMTRQITNMAEEQTSEPLRWWLRID